MDKLNFKKFKLPALLVLLGMLLGNISGGLAQSVQEWSDPVNLSLSGGTANPFMVVDGKGIIHVIWVDEFDGYKYSQSPDGLTWTAPVTVKYPFSPEANPPVMFTDPAGNIHIFWMDDLNKLSYAQTLPENLDSPPAWRTKSTVDSSVYDFDAGMDPQGRMHVTYLKNPAPASGTAGVFYKRSSDAGRTWSASSLLYESPYFRSLDAEIARIRMAVSDQEGDERIYTVWDDRSQKRIFIAASADGGKTWGPTKELVAPQSNLGFRTPYNADIDVLGDKVLATWFVGDIGGRCTPYSWSSADGGETWGEQAPIFGETAQCPEKSEFLPMDPDYSVSLFTVQGNLSLSAWNGTDWSNLEVQTGPSSITNPATFEPVLLACQQVAAYMDRMFVVGCDEGAGRDIWFLDRKLEPLESLFPLPSQWSGDTVVTSASQTLTSLSSVPDGAGNAHAVWIKSFLLPSDTSAPVIEYARWNGTEWTQPSPIIRGSDGAFLGLTLQIDSQQRLLLSWVNQETGDLMFTWSSSERANIPLEWSQPVFLSTNSKLANSPDMFVDASDRIVIAYAITLNEGRGIYIIQSTDLGETWSAPVRAFDAVAEGWEMVDQPKLAVTADGTLHMLFSRYEILGGPQPGGLYYTQSVDGGLTWSPVDVVSEQPVQWSELVAAQGTLHRMWQERTKSVARTSHQVSQDTGKAWAPPVKIPTDSDLDSVPSVLIDGDGTLHFMQVTGLDAQTFEEWEFRDERWQTVENRKVAGFELNAPPAVAGGITSDGHIYALIQIEKVLEDGIETDVWNISRSLERSEAASSQLATISTPSSLTTPVPTADLQPTPAATSPLAGLSDPEPAVNRNFIGLVLVSLIVVFLLMFMVPRRRKPQDKTAKQ